MSLAAAVYAVVYTAVDDSAPLLHDAPSLPSLTLSVAEWMFTRLTHVTGGPGGAGGNTGRQYSLTYDGADYTTFTSPKTRFCRGIGMCGLYAYAGYMRKNMVMSISGWDCAKCILFVVHFH